MLQVIKTNPILVVDGPVPEKQIARTILRVQDPNYRSSYAFRTGKWDGYHSFNLTSSKYKLPYQRGVVCVPIGLGDWFLHNLEARGVNYDLRDLSESHTYVFNDPSLIHSGLLQGIQLRDYQLDMIEAAVEAGRGVVCAPPRSGKTEVMLALAALTVPGRPALYLSHRAALVDQTVERAKLRGVRAVRVRPPIRSNGASSWEPPEGVQLLCATVPLLQRRLQQSWARRLLDRVGCVLVDECHFVGGSTSWTQVLANCSAPARFGFSGTPLHSTGSWDVRDAWLGALLGGIISKIELEDLEHSGSVLRAKGYMIDYGETRSHNKPFGWQDQYAFGISGNERFLQALVRVVETLVSAGRKVLVTCVHINHGMHIVKKLRERGLRAVFSFGGERAVFATESRIPQMSAKTSITTVAREIVAEGQADVLVGSTIADQGVDFPFIDSIVVGSGRKASTSTIQRAFRPLTAKADKLEPILVDFWHNKYDNLREHSEERARLYESAGVVTSLETVRLDEFIESFKQEYSKNEAT